MHLSIIIPIYNEETLIPSLLRQLYSLSDNVKIILVNDGSTDNTEKCLSTIPSSYTNIKVITLKKNYGKGFAIRQAIKNISTKFVCLVDGDLEISKKSLKKAIEILPHNYKNTVTVGIRWLKGNETKNLSGLGNYVVNQLFNLIFHENYNDILCCLKIIDTELIKSLKLTSNGFGIETEIMAKLSLNGVKVDEINVGYKSRNDKEGKKIKWYHLLTILYVMFKTRIFK